MLKTLNNVGAVCAVWFVIITVNAIIYFLSETAAAVLYLLSLLGFIGWLVFKATLAITKKERS